MTALAKRITETPMAPYMSILRAMSTEEKRILIVFLTESLTEADSEAETPKLSKAERKRGLMSLAGCWKDDPDAELMEAAIKEGRKK